MACTSTWPARGGSKRRQTTASKHILLNPSTEYSISFSTIGVRRSIPAQSLVAPGLREARARVDRRQPTKDPPLSIPETDIHTSPSSRPQYIPGTRSGIFSLGDRRQFGS
eukprot:879135-Rhodomonas_salina.1